MRSRLLILCAALGGCGAGGLPAKATVTTIDRLCTIITTETRKVPMGESGARRDSTKEVSEEKGECKSVAEWDEVRAKHSKKVDGEARVHVEYKAPQDGRIHYATVTYDGHDDEFYDLRAGDSIAIEISPDDPERIRKA